MQSQSVGMTRLTGIYQRKAAGDWHMLARRSSLALTGLPHGLEGLKEMEVLNVDIFRSYEVN